MIYKSGALNVVNIFVKSYELNGKKIVLSQHLEAAISARPRISSYHISEMELRSWMLRL
ncbi:MAG: hypothetical protein ACLS5W_11370 [Coprococcus sp.]|jgi:hypothetical protein